MGENLEIFARQVGGDVRFGSATALAVLLGDLVFEGTLLLGSVVIRICLNLMQGRGLKEQFGQRALVSRIGDVQGRPARGSHP